MEHFKNKQVCLVLSCDRPYYNDRRERNRETYKWFQDNGFVVVFLFASMINDPELSENCDGTFILRVPCLDVYELLSHKMELAYKYFNQTGCTGILKIDDDIQILNHQILSISLKNNICNHDYSGISVGRISHDMMHGNSLEIKKITLNLFKNLRLEIKNVVYMGGPFYWVSSNTIECIANDGLEFIYEDVSVGNVAMNHPELSRSFNEWMYNAVVTWDNATET
jgi:hypothetical protein